MCERVKPKNHYFWLSFFLLVVALALAIVAISLDEVTQVNFTLLRQHTTYYCGWQEFHSSDNDFFDQNNENDQTYEQNCKDFGGSFCHMEKVGNAWLALILVGIFFALIAMSGFVFNMCVSCHLFALGGSIIFGICMLAAIIQWSAEEKCSTACSDLSAVCHSEWGTSLILATISGCIAIISCIFYGVWD